MFTLKRAGKTFWSLHKNQRYLCSQKQKSVLPFQAPLCCWSHRHTTGPLNLKDYLKTFPISLAELSVGEIGSTTISGRERRPVNSVEGETALCCTEQGVLQKALQSGSSSGARRNCRVMPSLLVSLLSLKDTSLFSIFLHRFSLWET